MKIKWEVEDGYAGGNRPHYVEIPDSDFADLTDAQVEALIHDSVQDAFEMNIQPAWDMNQFDEALKVRDAQKEDAK